MNFVEVLLVWLAVHIIFLCANIEHYNWIFLKTPHNVIVPVIWIIAHIFSSVGITVALTGMETRSDFLELSIVLVMLLHLTTFCISNKMLFHYHRPEMALVISIGACAQSLIENILLGIATPTAGGFYFPMLFTTAFIQFGYGYYLYRRGETKAPEDPKVDFGNTNPNILSEYIKI